MKHIRVYQQGYPPEVFRDVGEDYKVIVMEHGGLRIEASGIVQIYNAHAWHSVEIYPEVAA